MIKTCLHNRNKSKSLTAQIRAAELRIVLREQRLGASAVTLINKIHQELTAPSTLLLAVGIGFIVGELSRRQTTNNRGETAGKQRTTGTAPLKAALNLITSVRTLYKAMPIAWKIRFFGKPGRSSRQASERQARPVAAVNSGRSNR